MLHTSSKAGLNYVKPKQSEDMETLENFVIHFPKKGVYSVAFKIHRGLKNDLKWTALVI